MTTRSGQSRRAFFKQVGAAAGAVTLSPAAMAEAGRPVAQFPAETARSVHPTLNRRARGWLRFLWEKATTPDDWSADGVPHMWWDRYSNPVVTSYGRFDLHNSSYALLLMADETPAWREVYTRIADGLASRYPTYWGAIDWLTQIGDDPRRANYPPHVMQMIPERLRGNYNRIGWTANGIEPWGLSPDPIGSEGNLFFRGWFNLVLGIYRYISGDDKYERPFEVTGYGDQVFEWDQHGIAALLERQYRERPEGPQCENTKIWFPCNASAGLGMYLYDRIHGRATHRPVEGWLEYARENFLGVGSDGRLEWVTSYYDPIVNHKANGGPGAGVGTAFLLLPQDRELATFIYESAANALGWNDPRVEIRASQPGLVMARELGDHTAVARLRAAAEREYDPRFFGDDNEMFGWWFGLNEAYPRGQRSASMMVAEVGMGDAWYRAFEAPHMDKFEAPTVEGIDFPSLGVYQAWNDTGSGDPPRVTETGLAWGVRFNADGRAEAGRDLDAQASLDRAIDRIQALFHMRLGRTIRQIAAVGLDGHAQPDVGNARDALQIIDDRRTARLNQQQVEILIAREDIQAAPRQAQLALQRLVGIGDRAHEDAHPAPVPRASQLRRQQFRRVGFDDQRLAPAFVRAPRIEPVGQFLGIAVGAAVDQAEAAADSPGQAVRVGPLAGGEEAALLWREDGLGLLVADVHAAYDSKCEPQFINNVSRFSPLSHAIICGIVASYDFDRYKNNETQSLQFRFWH